MDSDDGAAASSPPATDLLLSVSLTLEAVASDPELSRQVGYDLHAILNGWETIGEYTELERAKLRLMLGFITPQELTDMVGPPVLPRF